MRDSTGFGRFDLRVGYNYLYITARHAAKLCIGARSGDSEQDKGTKKGERQAHQNACLSPETSQVCETGFPGDGGRPASGEDKLLVPTLGAVGRVRGKRGTALQTVHPIFRPRFLIPVWATHGLLFVLLTVIRTR